MLLFPWHMRPFAGVRDWHYAIDPRASGLEKAVFHCGPSALELAPDLPEGHSPTLSY